MRFTSYINYIMLFLFSLNVNTFVRPLAITESIETLAQAAIRKDRNDILACGRFVFLPPNTLEAINESRVSDNEDTILIT